MQIATVLELIDLGSMALPEFQRGYVWNRDQVRGLMQSLYRRYPVGGLLVWTTQTENATTRGKGALSPGSVKLLLDGQQRITSLYGIIKGKSPKFFDGNAQSFTGLYFNLDEENFEFYAPVKMKDNPLWINVTELMQKGVGDFASKIFTIPDSQQKFGEYIQRLTAIENIKKIDVYVEEVTGQDKTVDIVVDIFNRVNSGGTKLSKGDLALAKVCAEWPAARDEMKIRLDKWYKAGFSFRLEWLLRCINTTLTGEALFSAMEKVDTPMFQAGLKQTEKYIDTLLNMISGRLGLDYEGVLGSRYAFPVLARYLSQRGNKSLDYRERDKLLYWYVHTMLWGRYAGSTESIINQDLGQIEQLEGGLDRLIQQLHRDRSDLHINSRDFDTWSTGSRFYPLLYMLTRVWHAKDWGSGIELSNNLLGNLNRLQVHHIFPKALLYKHGGYPRSEVNAIANFTFLTQDTNLKISDRNPTDYMPEIRAKHPGALESCWIPMDPELWKVENFKEFLAARRELLAKAANDFLNSLLGGLVPETPSTPSIFERNQLVVSGGIESEEEEELILNCNIWITEQNLPIGEMNYELVDGETNQPLAILDLAWPQGLQEGLSKPVALLIDEDANLEQVVNQAGYRFFTNVETFKEYVRRDILALTA